MDLKLNLCCGNHIIEGWKNLDNRDHVNNAIVKWDWDQPIPEQNSTVDRILISYGLMYTPKEKYVEKFIEFNRVLKSGGLLIIKEDDDKKRVWKKIGTNHFTGTIRSTSNYEEMEKIAKEGGFKIVYEGYPADCEKILDTHRRARKNSYILTAIKI